LAALVLFSSCKKKGNNRHTTCTGNLLTANFISQMKKNFLQLFIMIYVPVSAILFIYLFNSISKSGNSFEEISVKRINVIDEAGHNRMVISNQDLMPNPIIAGKEYERKIAPAGIIFYDEKGDEIGGLALSTLNNSGLRALSFDYANADAIGLLSQEDLNGNNFRAGILIMDKDLSGKPGSNISRLKLITENGNAGLFINGPDEKPRISIVVDSVGNPSIQLFDENGKVKKPSFF
jgi:hypothetical protein